MSECSINRNKDQYAAMQRLADEQEVRNAQKKRVVKHIKKSTDKLLNECLVAIDSMSKNLDSYNESALLSEVAEEIKIVFKKHVK